ncbi:hypothetical protein [Nonomuraea sp. NPDC048826]|uniref:hypothetical protein n=1 Tax=Nonomuraea sp. NPDC048826 TaxID=3364347 RepID=UPI00371847AD
MGLAFQRRVLAAVLPVCERYGMALAGAAALRAHGIGCPPGDGLEFAGGPPAVVDELAVALWEAGLEVSVEGGRLIAVDPAEGLRCPVEAGDGAPLEPPVRRDGLPVVTLDDAVGLRVRDLHERGLARDVADLAAVAQLYSFRELERLGGRLLPGFSLQELGMRLGFAGGVGGEDGPARRFAAAWLEDLALRRAEDGDADYDHPDLPVLD